MNKSGLIFIAILLALFFSSCGGGGISSSTSQPAVNGESSSTTNPVQEDGVRNQDDVNKPSGDGLSVSINANGKVLNMRSAPYDPCANAPCKEEQKVQDTIESRKLRYIPVTPQNK